MLIMILIESKHLCTDTINQHAIQKIPTHVQDPVSESQRTSQNEYKIYNLPL